MEYQMVIRFKNERYWAFYLDASAPPVYDFDSAFVVADSVKEVLKRAQAIKPDGPILFTYIDRSDN